MIPQLPITSKTTSVGTTFIHGGADIILFQLDYIGGEVCISGKLNCLEETPPGYLLLILWEPPHNSVNCK